MESLGARVSPGIRIVDAVHLGGFEKGVGADFAGSEGGCGVGGEEGMSCAGGKDHDSSFLQVTQGTTANERFCHILHLDSGQDSGLDSCMLKGVLEGEGVDHGGQHTHVVGRVAVHLTFVGRRGASPNITASDHDTELERGREDAFDLVGEALDDGVREVVGGVAQCFARKFEEEATCFVRVGWGEGVGLLAVGKIFGRTTRDGGRAGGFCGGFFLGTTGGHDGVWRETGSQRKENFLHLQFRLGRPLPAPFS